MINKLDFSETCSYTLSANEIRQYCDCPRKRYYASRDCLAIRTNIKNKNLELGRAIHLTLAYYYTELDRKIKEAGIKRPTLEQCEDLYSTIESFQLVSAEEGGATLSIVDEQIYKCMIDNYKEQIIDDLVNYEILNCEEEFNMINWPIDGVRYHGNVDMTVRDRESDLVYFFEHKTCRDFRPEIYDRFDIQLHIYDVYGYKKYGSCFGGMILNQLKKAKTSRGFDIDRKFYIYDEQERNDFYTWIKAKTFALVSPNNFHEPCNNYMSCKVCEYSSICMKYGYSVPKTTNDIIKDSDLVFSDFDENTGEEVIKPMFKYDPREGESIEENE